MITIYFRILGPSLLGDLGCRPFCRVYGLTLHGVPLRRLSINDPALSYGQDVLLRFSREFDERIWWRLEQEVCVRGWVTAHHVTVDVWVQFFVVVDLLNYLVLGLGVDRRDRNTSRRHQVGLEHCVVIYEPVEILPCTFAYRIAYMCLLFRIEVVSMLLLWIVLGVEAIATESSV